MPKKKTTRKVLEVQITSPMEDAVRITSHPELSEKNFRLKKGCTSLMYACQQGLTDRVIEKVHREAAIIIMTAPELMEQADEDGFKPIHLAVIQGSLETVNLLLANKVDLNALDEEGHSVIHWSTVCGETQILRTLLKAGANVKLSDHNGATPLHYAAQMCGYDGKNSEKHSSNKKLALDILDILLKHPKTKVEAEDKDGRQPLLWAASCGSVEAIFALVKAGANAESCDKDGLSALHCSASRGHTNCIDSLVKLCGVKTDLIDSNGCTALFYAVTLGHADSTSKLLDLGADPNRQDRKGRSSAHCGCAKGQLETIKILNSRGANLWLRNAKGDLPLHEAASSGRTELVEWLLAQKPNHINSSSNDGRNVLHIAASNDYIDMCRMLIEKGAEFNAVYRNSKNVVKTPLDCAMQKGFRATAKFIQSHGGLPANKLRLSGRKPQAVIPEFDVDVGPIKISDSTQESKSNSKQRDSESDSDSKNSRKRRKCSHKRRASSCSETFVCHRVDEPCEISRSKSSSELSRRRKSRRSSSTTTASESSDSESEDNESQCCCHVKRKHRCYKKVKHRPTANKSKDNGKNNHKKINNKNRFTESENDEEKTIEKSTREKKVEIISSENKKKESKSLSSTSSKDGGKKISVVSNMKRSPSNAKGPTSKKKLGFEGKKKSEEKEKSQDKSPLASKKASDEEDMIRETMILKTEATTVIEVLQDGNIDTLRVPSNSEIDDGLLTDATYVIETDTKTMKEDTTPAEEIKIDDMLIGNANGPISGNVESKSSVEAVQQNSEPIDSDAKDQYYEDNMEKDEGIKEDDTTSAEECQPMMEARSSESRSSFQVLNESDDAYEKLREFEERTKLNGTDDTIMLNEQTLTSDRENNAEPDDSGIEPSPRVQRNKLTYQSQPTTFYSDDFENRKPGDKNACNMTTVQQSIQKNMRRYYMERKIFQHLLELKSLQIRSCKSNEAILVKRAVEDYHKSVSDLGYEIGGTLSKFQMREFTFKNFELFLYETLKTLQKPGTFNFQNISEVYKEAERRINPDFSRYERALHCTTKSHRCLHATHAYTGIPCAAYIPIMNHHTIPKIGFGPLNKATNTHGGSIYLPKILSNNRNRQNRVSIELSQGNNKNTSSSTIVLPSQKMDTNKKYLVTFSLKEKENNNNNNVIESSAIKKGEE